MSRPFLTGLFSFVLGIAFTFVGARTMPVILDPGLVITLHWLRVDFDSRAFGMSVFAFDILIYTGIFGITLWLLGRFASRLKDRISH